MLVSYVIPCYRSEKTLPVVVREIDEKMKTLPGYTHEIIMVCAGSPDNVWKVICDLSREKASRRGILFSKNFGQHAALMAGIRAAGGERIICLDDDGQTPASEADRLLEALDNGADVAYARYAHKQHSLFRNLGTMMNEEMAYRMLGKPKALFVSSYFAMRRFVADEIIRYENSYPYLIGLVLRTTSNIVNVDVNHRARQTGSSGYTLSKLISLWMNGFTAFSVKPLRIATLVGTLSAIGGFLYGLYTIVKKFVRPDVPVGFSALMSAVVLFGGLILLMLGMVGEYVGRTYISANRAPQYVIRERTEDPDAPEKDPRMNKAADIK